MIVLATSGESIASIARQMGTCRARVGEWVRRFRSEGIERLRDEPRSGRPGVITPLERHQVIAAACKTPADLGVDRRTWTYESLRDAVIEAGLVRHISSSEVGRLLDGADLKPHRVRSWCHSTDPDYQRKMRSIVRLYMRPTGTEPVLCIDEKTGMQALSRSRDLQPQRPDALDVRSSSIGAMEPAACLPASTWAPAKCLGAARPRALGRTSWPSWTWSRRPSAKARSTSCWTI
jgi:transposase